MRKAPRVILAGWLGLAASVLVACGGSSGLLSGTQAETLQAQLDQVSSALGSKQCATAINAATAFKTAVDGLPGSVNATLTSNLNQGATTLSQLTAKQCPTTTATATTSAKTSSSTSSETSSAPPSSTTTSSTTSTTTPTTTTSSTSSSSSSSVTTSTPSTTSSATTQTSSGNTSTTGGTGGAGLGNNSGSGSAAPGTGNQGGNSQ